MSLAAKYDALAQQLGEKLSAAREVESWLLPFSISPGKSDFLPFCRTIVLLYKRIKQSSLKEIYNGTTKTSTF